ncbi:hypothetical protein [Microbacterium sp. Se5.02b]|nr:hypothetical protein [Microbacterium sp. Se5.02b]
MSESVGESGAEERQLSSEIGDGCHATSDMPLTRDDAWAMP